MCILFNRCASSTCHVLQSVKNSVLFLLAFAIRVSLLCLNVVFCFLGINVLVWSKSFVKVWVQNFAIAIEYCIDS